MSTLMAELVIIRESESSDVLRNSHLHFPSGTLPSLACRPRYGSWAPLWEDLWMWRLTPLCWRLFNKTLHLTLGVDTGDVTLRTSMLPAGHTSTTLACEGLTLTWQPHSEGVVAVVYGGQCLGWFQNKSGPCTQLEEAGKSTTSTPVRPSPQYCLCWSDRMACTLHNAPICGHQSSGSKLNTPDQSVSRITLGKVSVVCFDRKHTPRSLDGRMKRNTRHGTWPRIPKGSHGRRFWVRTDLEIRREIRQDTRRSGCATSVPQPLPKPPCWGPGWAANPLPPATADQMAYVWWASRQTPSLSDVCHALDRRFEKWPNLTPSIRARSESWGGEARNWRSCVTAPVGWRRVSERWLFPSCRPTEVWECHYLENSQDPQYQKETFRKGPYPFHLGSWWPRTHISSCLLWPHVASLLGGNRIKCRS